MEVRPRGLAGAADASYPCARPPPPAEPNVDARKVRVHRPPAVAVRDRDKQPPAAASVTRPHDSTRSGGADRRPRRRREVDTGVEARAAGTEAVADPAAERPCERDRQVRPRPTQRRKKVWGGEAHPPGPPGRPGT